MNDWLACCSGSLTSCPLVQFDRFVEADALDFVRRPRLLLLERIEQPQPGRRPQRRCQALANDLAMPLDPGIEVPAWNVSVSCCFRNVARVAEWQTRQT